MHDADTTPLPRVDDRSPGGRRRRPDSSTDPDPTGERGPEPDHGHGHGHGPAEPASRRVKVLLTALVAPVALAAIVGVVLLYPSGDAGEPASAIGQRTPVRGDVVAVETGDCGGGAHVAPSDAATPPEHLCLIVTVRMTDGQASGREITTLVPMEPNTPRFGVTDRVVLAFSGGDPTSNDSYQLVDFQRGTPLALLAALFAVAVLALGRFRGLAALAALGLSFVVLVMFILPAIIAGENPLMVAVAGAGVIMFVVLYVTHGFSARTSTAVLGTMVSLALIGGLGALFSAATTLTGLDEDTGILIGALGHGIDARGLLLAGVVIGALGVLDDVTVTQTSAVWELRRANPSLNWRQLYGAGVRIGRDHVASAVNTLVMAYAGAALPVLLYSSLSGVGLGNILSSQSIAQEIVRTLVGSIGLVACVPVTTAVAALVASHERVPEGLSPRRRRTASRPRA